MTSLIASAPLHEYSELLGVSSFPVSSFRVSVRGFVLCRAKQITVRSRDSRVDREQRTAVSLYYPYPVGEDQPTLAPRRVPFDNDC